MHAPLIHAVRALLRRPVSAKQEQVNVLRVHGLSMPAAACGNPRTTVPLHFPPILASVHGPGFLEQRHQTRNDENLGGGGDATTEMSAWQG
jgi:hypothetical protein